MKARQTISDSSVFHLNLLVSCCTAGLRTLGMGGGGGGGGILPEFFLKNEFLTNCSLLGNTKVCCYN